MKICFVAAFPPSGRQLNEYAFHIARELQKDPLLSLTILSDELESPAPELPEFDVVRCWRFNSLSRSAGVRCISRPAVSGGPNCVTCPCTTSPKYTVRSPVSRRASRRDPCVFAPPVRAERNMKTLDGTMIIETDSMEGDAVDRDLAYELDRRVIAVAARVYPSRGPFRLVTKCRKRLRLQWKLPKSVPGRIRTLVSVSVLITTTPAK